tara:strand:+ start:893 stop:2608 length:1716 start_codon:yes stop_codon:yes gene_type:complete
MSKFPEFKAYYGPGGNPESRRDSNGQPIVTKEGQRRLNAVKKFAGEQALYAGIGGMGFGGAQIFNNTRNNSDYTDSFDRLDFAKDISGLDPELKADYIKNGRYFNPARKLPFKGTDFIPPDTSQRGGYLTNLRNSDGLESIATVTPTATSSRFGGVKEGMQQGAGAQTSNTLWGHRSNPVYSYADNNYAAGKLSTADPSIHFSGADLQPSEKGKYLYTGGANEAATKGVRPTWGVEDSSQNIMFGSESRRIGGLTTAADLYQFADELGLKPQPKGYVSNSQYLSDLTKKISDATGKSEFRVVEDLASPHPVSGNPGRATGKVPTVEEFTLKNMKPNTKSRIGWGSLLEENNDPFEPNHIPLPEKSDAYIQMTPEAASPKQSAYSKFVKGRSMGIAGAALTSPEAAKLLREGRVGEAAATVGGGYVGGEVFGGGLRMATDRLVKAGITQAPNALSALSSIVATPLTAIGAIDTASTLATGKNARELAVDSGNFGPAIQAMSTPRTMAPLAGAGSLSDSVGMQATVPNLSPKRKEESETLQKKVKQARERGGRWKIGGFTIPDFGFSEGLDIN